MSFTEQRTGYPLAALAAVLIAAATVVPPALAVSHHRARAAATTVQVQGGEFFFKLSTKSIAKPGAVTFVFKNVGTVSHNFSIDGKTTPLIAPGKTTKLAVTFKKKGTFAYRCTVPGHAEAGMKGVFTVR